MDLISIARKYKNVRRSIEVVFVIVLIIYVILGILKFIDNKKIQQIYQSYKIIYEEAEKIRIAQEEKDRLEQTLRYKKSWRLGEKEANYEWTEKIRKIYKNEEKNIFLTFDDGPNKKITLPILDLLKEQDVKATFFVLGSRVDLYPEIVKRAYEEGHYIANHGYSHEYSKIYESTQNLLDEYYKTEDSIRRAIGNDKYSSYLFRFPGGSSGGKYAQFKKDAKNELTARNIAYVDWNALTGDSEGVNRTVEQLLDRLEETLPARNTVVLLMHDAADKQCTYDALPLVIQKLRDKGYEFKTFYDFIEEY